MINSSYDARTTRSYKTDRIEQSLNERLRSNEIRDSVIPDNIPSHVQASLQEKTNIVYLVENKDIPSFSHPIQLDHKDGFKRIVVDMRPFVRYDRMSDTAHSTNVTEYSIALARAVLEELWANDIEGRRNLSNMSTYPLKLFTVYVTNTISRIYNLSLAEQGTISTICAAWYLSSFIPEDQIERFDRQVFTTKIARITKNNPRTILETLERLTPMRTIDDFASNIQMNSGTSRTESFQIGLLFNQVAGGWMGTYAREMVPLAMEFPPTWIALAAASTEEGYRRTAIGQTAKVIFSRDDMMEFKGLISRKLYGG